MILTDRPGLPPESTTNFSLMCTSRLDHYFFLMLSSGQDRGVSGSHARRRSENLLLVSGIVPVGGLGADFKS